MTDTNAFPLVVDLDGALLRSSLADEALVSGFLHAPAAAIASLVRGKRPESFRSGKAAIDPAKLPMNLEVVGFLRKERAAGRTLYLAATSDARQVQAVADHLGLFSGVFGSSDGIALTGAAKADRLCRAFGENGFDYIGSDRSDMPVWSRCRRAFAADVTPNLRRCLRRDAPEVEILSHAPPRLKTFRQAIRLHHWLKNLLIFLPLLAAHNLSAKMWGIALIAAGAFSLVASAIYLFNDLMDLFHDRGHRNKRDRPLASGAMSPLHALALIPSLLGGAFLLVALAPPACLTILVFYLVLTIAYSLFLKRQAMLDVIVLACLYTLRILMGSVGIGVPASPWLLAFSTFFFLSLAIVKRLVELVELREQSVNSPGGRSYQRDDLPVLSALAGASGYGSVVILALYFNSPEMRALYRNPEILWLLNAPLIYWISRMLLLAHRGNLHDDPVVYAVTDRVSLLTGIVTMIILGLAI